MENVFSILGAEEGDIEEFYDLSRLSRKYDYNQTVILRLLLVPMEDERVRMYVEGLEESRLEIQITILGCLRKKGPTPYHNLDFFFIEKNHDYGAGDAQRTDEELRELFELGWVSDGSVQSSPENLRQPDGSISTPRPPIALSIFITKEGERALKLLDQEKQSRMAKTQQRTQKRERRHRIFSLRHIMDGVLLIFGLVLIYFGFGGSVTIELGGFGIEGYFGTVCCTIALLDMIGIFNKKLWIT